MAPWSYVLIHCMTNPFYKPPWKQSFLHCISVGEHLCQAVVPFTNSCWISSFLLKSVHARFCDQELRCHGDWQQWVEPLIAEQIYTSHHGQLVLLSLRLDLLVFAFGKTIVKTISFYLHSKSGSLIDTFSSSFMSILISWILGYVVRANQYFIQQHVSCYNTYIWDKNIHREM